LNPIAPFYRSSRRTLGRAWWWVTRPVPQGPIFHVTHHKAGSQWIRHVLDKLLSPWLVAPEADNSQFLSRPIAKRGVYPTLYITREQFDSVALPDGWKRFIVIRDLRDTLISLYFSLKVSHRVMNPNMRECRDRLQSIPQEHALRSLIRNTGDRIADLQRSWIGGEDVVFKYEDFLIRDGELFERILLEHCGLPIPRHQIQEAVAANRFEARAGRKPGEEDQSAHERKGIAGDWRNYFTDSLAKEFKDRFGEHLVATGYEKDDRW
jgi:lipopolysaccharide transport system ATP-binding protein